MDGSRMITAGNSIIDNSIMSIPSGLINGGTISNNKKT